MLEVIYATGVRVSELTHLRLQDIRSDLGYITCSGKGGKIRVVPLGKSALRALEDYLKIGRPALEKQKRSDDLFLNARGIAMTRQGFWKIIREYGRKAKFRFRYALISCGIHLPLISCKRGRSPSSPINAGTC